MGGAGGGGMHGEVGEAMGKLREGEELGCLESGVLGWRRGDSPRPPRGRMASVPVKARMQ